MKHLKGPRYEKEFFKHHFQPEEFFTYNEDWYLYSDVESLCKSHGMLIKYADVTSSEYKLFGPFVCEVIGRIDMIKKDSRKLLFDPKDLFI
jgi:hypothetical protein